MASMVGGQHHVSLLTGCAIILLYCSSIRSAESASYLRTVVGDVAASDSSSEWNYGCVDGMNGPSEWGRLSKEWSICGQGISQSPILIQTGALQTSQELKPLNLAPSKASVSEYLASAFIRKNVFKLYVGGWSLLLDNVKYNLHQMHFHTRAEHRIDGAMHAMELQHEFISHDGKFAIISVFYKYGKNSNPYLGQYFKYLPQLQGEHSVANVTVPVHLVQEELYPYYYYKGSLSRPPCTEGVTWILSQNVKVFSQVQAEALKESTKGYSNRPLQPVNGRKVFSPAY